MAEPDQSLRARITAITFMALFGISALILAWFGFHDLLGGTIYGVRLRAAAMIAEAFYFLIAMGAMVLVLRRQSAPAGDIALIGGTLSAATGIVLLVYQLVNGDYTHWILVWLGMAGGGAFVVLRLLQAGARFPYPKQLTIAVAVTSFVAIANFSYTSLYQPSADPPEFGVDVELGVPAFNPEGTIASVPIKISANAQGKIGMQVVAATYSVLGRHGSVSAVDQTKEQMNLAVEHGRPASRTTAVPSYDLLQTDEFIGQGALFTPGDSLTVTRTVDLRLPTEYDAIALSATAVIVRRDDAIINQDTPQSTEYSWEKDGSHDHDAPMWVADTGVDFLRRDFLLEETNFLREQTRQKWTGSVWRVLGEPTPDNPLGGYLAWQFAPKGSSSNVDSNMIDHDNRVAGDRYGVDWTETGWYEKSAYELKLKEIPRK